MDEDGNVPNRFRLPNSFAESDDPIERNPFPPEHPAHQVWLEATRRAQGEISRINADAFVSQTLTKADGMAALVVEKFDVWAERGLQGIFTDDAAWHYARWLVDYANAWIDGVWRRMEARAPALLTERVLADLHRRLSARVQHWKAEAVQYRVQRAAYVAAMAAPEIQRPLSDQLVRRRRLAVKKYRDDHDLNAAGFAQKVGISETAVRGIIREDSERFNRSSQQKLLAVIGMTQEDWYRE